MGSKLCFSRNSFFIKRLDEEEEMVDVMVDHTQLGGMLLKSTAMGYVAKVKRFVQLNPDMVSETETLNNDRLERFDLRKM